MWNRDGITREVFLIGRYAFKLPKLTYGWKAFVNGLLANMQEATFGVCGLPELCPVVWRIPGGFLIVMRRAEPMPQTLWRAFDAEAFCTRHGTCELPVERKRDSFGLLDGRIVAVDYGN